MRQAKDVCERYRHTGIMCAVNYHTSCLFKGLKLWVGAPADVNSSLQHPEIT